MQLKNSQKDKEREMKKIQIGSRVQDSATGQLFYISEVQKDRIRVLKTNTPPSKKEIKAWKESTFFVPGFLKSAEDSKRLISV